MRTRAFTLVGAYMLLLLCLPAFGQATHDNHSIHPTKASGDNDDPVAILEVGAATNWNFSGGAAMFAPNLAAECTPTLAIWLVIHHNDLSEKQRESLLSRAIEVAASDEEKQLARLELAAYYLANGKSSQAMSLVQAILDETTSGKASDERSSAMVLKWAISCHDTDFPPAFEAMKRQSEEADRISR